MTTLRVLEGGGGLAVEAYAPTAFDLRVQPTRPGMAHEIVELVLDRDRAGAVQEAANAEGVSSELWASVAIESERALQAAADASGVERECFKDALDAASERPVTNMPGRGARRLFAYAQALRRQDSNAPPGLSLRLSVVVAYHSHLAWTMEAARAGTSVASWAEARLAVTPAGRLRWEAAAAEAGQTLGEWVALQAARRARC